MSKQIDRRENPQPFPLAFKVGILSIVCMLALLIPLLINMEFNNCEGMGEIKATRLWLDVAPHKGITNRVAPSNPDSLDIPL